jgi:purine-binding chemotaxis protein CheW
MSVDPQEWLLFQVGSRRCALPLGCVVETLRPLPIQPLPNETRIVSGLSVIRGVPVPIVDVGEMLGEAGGAPTRFITIAIGERLVALTVDAVLAVRPIPEAALAALPPLLHEAAHNVVAAIGLMDGELLLCLEAGRLIPTDGLDAGAEARDRT